MASIKQKTFDDEENSSQKKKQCHSEESGEIRHFNSSSDCLSKSFTSFQVGNITGLLPSDIVQGTQNLAENKNILLNLPHQSFDMNSSIYGTVENLSPNLTPSDLASYGYSTDSISTPDAIPPSSMKISLNLEGGHSGQQMLDYEDHKPQSKEQCIISATNHSIHEIVDSLFIPKSPKEFIISTSDNVSTPPIDTPKYTSLIHNTPSSLSCLTKTKEDTEIPQPSEATIQTAGTEIPLPSEATSKTAASKIPLPSEATIQTADSEIPLPSEAAIQTADSEIPQPSETTSQTADREISLPSEAACQTADSEIPLPSEATSETADSENPLPSETTSQTAEKPEDAERQEQAPPMSLPPRRKIRRPIGKASCQHSRLYRLLREDEQPKEEGIKAQSPNANKSVREHVNFGSNFTSQFISTSASMAAVRDFASCRFSKGKRIATINVDELTKLGDVYYIDLTDRANRDKYRLEGRAVTVARKYTEVLILGDIPPTCKEDITVIE